MPGLLVVRRGVQAGARVTAPDMPARQAPPQAHPAAVGAVLAHRIGDRAASRRVPRRRARTRPCGEDRSACRWCVEPALDRRARLVHRRLLRCALVAQGPPHLDVGERPQRRDRGAVRAERALTAATTSASNASSRRPSTRRPPARAVALAAAGRDAGRSALVGAEERSTRRWIRSCSEAAPAKTSGARSCGRQLQALQEVLAAAPGQVVERGEERIHGLEGHARLLGDLRPRRLPSMSACCCAARASTRRSAAGRVDHAGLAGLVAVRRLEARRSASSMTTLRNSPVPMGSAPRSRCDRRE